MDAFRVLAMKRSDEIDGSTAASALTLGAMSSLLVRTLCPKTGNGYGRILPKA